MQLVQEGKIKLDDPVSKYGITLESEGVIRVKHLLSHTSEGNPGARYSYNGNRFAELDRVIERATGKSFGELLIANILDPLDMSETAPNVPRIVSTNHQAEPIRCGSGSKSRSRIVIGFNAAASTRLSGVWRTANRFPGRRDSLLLYRCSELKGALQSGFNHVRCTIWNRGLLNARWPHFHERDYYARNGPRAGRPLASSLFWNKQMGSGSLLFSQSVMNRALIPARHQQDSTRFQIAGATVCSGSG